MILVPKMIVCPVISDFLSFCDQNRNKQEDTFDDLTEALDSSKDSQYGQDDPKSDKNSPEPESVEASLNCHGSFSVTIFLMSCDRDMLVNNASIVFMLSSGGVKEELFAAGGTILF